MDEVRLCERLTAVEASVKNAHRRLDDIKELVESIRTLACEVKTMRIDLNDLRSDIERIKSEPGRRWDSVVKTGLTAAVSAIVGYAVKTIL